MHTTVIIILFIAAVNGQQNRPSFARQQHVTNDQLSVEEQLKLSHKIALGVLQLSQQLTERAIAANNNSFEVLSPISIASALQLVTLGAKGSTYDELIQLMGYGNYSPRFIHQEFAEIIADLKLNTHNPKRDKAKWLETADEHYRYSIQRFQDPSPNYEHHKIEVANGIFVQSDVNIRPEYQSAVRDVYKSEIESLNFRGAPSQASQFINDWVERKTHGKIKQIVPPVMNPFTRVVLANALYFKAQWLTSFFERATRPTKFFPNGRDKVDDFIMTDLMAHGGHFPHHYDPESNVEILGLPYKQNCTTMYIIMPRDSSKDRLKEVQKQLTADKIEDMIEKMTVKSAVMLFPKMHLKSGYRIKGDLQDLGVRSLFEQSGSDLSLMAKAPSGEYYKGRRNRRDISYKVASENKKSPLPLSIKDFFNRKRIIKNGHGKKNKRSRRSSGGDPLSLLDELRSYNLPNPQLFADEVIHKVDLTINEKGTEGGAATVISINRSTAVVFRVDVPFMFLIRHDSTKIPLFYGVVFQPPAADDVNEDCEKMLRSDKGNDTQSQ